MTNSVSLSTGLLVGFAIAMPIGPMGLLCIQRTLTSGMKTGISTGFGAATVNVTHGAAMLLGLDTLSPWIASSRHVLSALSGLFLLWSASRTLMRRGTLRELSGNAALSPLEAFGSAVMFNAANPMALVLIVALLAPVIGRSTPSLAEATALLLGMFIAASGWWMLLSGGVALLRTRLTPTILGYLNQAAGLLLTIYGATALARSVGM
jgi:threonine/homoserine/homoserine lactone efflux protein